MPDRFWVGGSGTWNSSNTTNWSATSGGAGGASVPTTADNVFFNAASGASTVTISTGATARSINCTGFTGTLAGSTAISIAGSITLASAMGYTYTGTITLTATGTIITAGKTISSLTLNGSGQTFTLGSALTSSGTINITLGTFTTANFSVTATTLSSSNSNTRTINLGSSTVTLSGSTPINMSTVTGLTFNAGTSNISCTSVNPILNTGGRTFNSVSLTSSLSNSATINGAATFTNLSVAARSSSGICSLSFADNITITGLLTLSASANPTRRTYVHSGTIGITRTLTCNSVSSLSHIDFRDILVQGNAAPFSGTGLGDCGGNVNITGFSSPKTVYWNLTSGGNWSSTAWATAPLGTPDIANFPLPQDTAVIENGGLNSTQTITIDASYNIGTIDMSARTVAMILATSSNLPIIHGSWLNGSGTSLSGSGKLTFAGRNANSITSAGKVFPQFIEISCIDGSITLMDAFSCSYNSTGTPSLTLSAGTFNDGGYSVTLSATSNNTGFQCPSTVFSKSVVINGTWTIASGSTTTFSVSASNLSVQGSGVISLTSANAKTFGGNNIQSYPTLNQGGAGALSITGSNKFLNLTNTAIGIIQFNGGSTNEFVNFSINGAPGTPLTLRSTNTTQAILRKPSPWNVGANSTDAGNNTGISFVAGGNDYLAVSYINGQVSLVPSFFIFF